MRYLISETDWTMMSLAQELLSMGVLVTRLEQPHDLQQFLSVGQNDLLLVNEDHLQRSGTTLRALRTAARSIPIVMVSSETRPTVKATWLADGADAILDPSVATDQSYSQLQAIARRALGHMTSVIECGPLSIHLDTRQARISGKPLRLSPKVYEMLEYIALRPDMVVTRDALLTHVYGLDMEPDSRVFDVYACTLRNQLKAAEGRVRLETVRGTGFRLHFDQAAAA